MCSLCAVVGAYYTEKKAVGELTEFLFEVGVQNRINWI